MDDEIIKKNLIDELYWDGKVDASDVKAKVDSGEVELDGTVPTYGAKIAADRDAWNLAGVRLVKNKLDVETKVEVPSDDRIQEMVNNKILANTNLYSFKIDSDVNAGIVTLKGTVDAYWKKITAETEAQTVPGVINVINKIAIAPREDYVDEEVAKDIVDAMSRKATVPARDVNVTVKDGKVNLTGTVPNWTAFYEAERAAERTLGVIDIDNNLRIEA